MGRKNGTQAVDLERLTQSQVAWLTGKPAVWFRDNTHLVERNADGTYDGRQVVRGIRTEFQAAELSDTDLEHVHQFAESIVYDLDGKATLIHQWRGIVKRNGAAGLAAIAKVIVDELEQAHERFGDPDPASVESLKAEFEEKLAFIEKTNLRAARKTVMVCEYCGKYRWGRRWIQAKPPAELAEWNAECPDCEKRLR